VAQWPVKIATNLPRLTKGCAESTRYDARMLSRSTAVKLILVALAAIGAYVVLVMLSDAQDPYGTPDEDVVEA
jgi:hypothetical protein